MFLPSIDRRITGLNFSAEGMASILTWAPAAAKVEVEVREKGIYALQKEDCGYWSYKSPDIKPNDKYWLVIDGTKKLPDPASLSQPEGVHGPSEAIVLDNFMWADKSWKGISFYDLIIYELHTGTFTPEGTFEGIIGKLDYLKELGVTAIEIMPVAQFPGSRNWGYDGVYPFAVQQSYGGIQGLMKLVDACHRKQLAVILDVVYNHLGPEGNYLPAYGPCFTEKYKIPWGLAINFDDEWCDGIRNFCIDNALMWLRDFHIDGLRLDAVHAIKDYSARHILQELKEYVKHLNTQSGKNHFLIGECDLNDTKYISPLEKGGYDLDAQWCDEFHHALHTLVTGETDGYYSDFGSIDQLSKSFRDAYVYDGIFTPHRKKVFGSKTTGISGYKFVVFAQNHDHIGNRMMGDRLTTLVDFETLKLIAGTVFLSPYIPLIFMGEEYGETNPFLYFTSHTDPSLIELVVKGRLEEFKSFKNNKEPLNPQSEATFSRSKLKWKYNEQKRQTQLLSFYKELIRLRKFYTSIKSMNRTDLLVDIVEGKNVIILRNKQKINHLTTILNFEKSDVKIDKAMYLWDGLKLILYSAEEIWGGPLKQQPLVLENTINVKARSIMILSTPK